MNAQLLSFAALLKCTLVFLASFVLLNNTVIHDTNNLTAFDMEIFDQEHISEDVLNDLIEKNIITYRYFYSYDSRDEAVCDYIYTVNMPDFKNYRDFFPLFPLFLLQMP